MSIASSDLIAYMPANKVTDDVSTIGGAIDPLYRPVFTQLAGTDTVEVLSNSAGDTQNCTITGRDATGTYQTETLALTGVTPKVFVTSWERILSVTLASVAVGTITVRRSDHATAVGTIPATEKGFYALFIKSASSTSGTTTRYEKTFWKNTHGSLTLTSAACRLAADTNSVIQQGIAAAVDDVVTAANRLTAPAGISFVGLNIDQSVPGGGNLPAASAVGVWWSLTLAQNNPAIKSTFTSRITGQSV